MSADLWEKGNGERVWESKRPMTASSCFQQILIPRQTTEPY